MTSTDVGIHRPNGGLRRLPGPIRHRDASPIHPSAARHAAVPVPGSASSTGQVSS